MEQKIIKGYKALNQDMSSTCGDMKYEVGKQYRLEGDLKLRENGYHFCENAMGIFKYYDIDFLRFFEVEARGNIISNGEKSCTDNIRLVRELLEDEVITIINENYINEGDYVREIVAQSKYTNNETLEKLSNDDDWGVRYGVAKNPNTNIGILEKLSNDDYWGVRCNIAGHPNTNIGILETLSNDNDSYVRLAVAENTKTDAKILEKLSTDDNWRVRCAVCKNSKTNLETLEKLSNDEESYVKYALVRNPNTDRKILKKLSNDEHPGLRHKANEILNKKN